MYVCLSVYPFVCALGLPLTQTKSFTKLKLDKNVTSYGICGTDWSVELKVKVLGSFFCVYEYICVVATVHSYVFRFFSVALTGVWYFICRCIDSEYWHLMSTTRWFGFVVRHRISMLKLQSHSELTYLKLILKGCIRKHIVRRYWVSIWKSNREQSVVIILIIMSDITDHWLSKGWIMFIIWHCNNTFAYLCSCMCCPNISFSACFFFYFTSQIFNIEALCCIS